jgi:hypothetical protein
VSRLPRRGLSGAWLVVCVLALEGVRMLESEGERSRNPPGEVEAGDMGTRRDDMEDRAVSASASAAGIDHVASVIVREEDVAE